MAQEQYTGELNFDTNWGEAGESKLPVGGNDIQKFVRTNLANSYRDVVFEPQNGNRLVFFATSEDKRKYIETGDTSLILNYVSLEIAGTTYLVKLTNIKDSTSLSITTNDESLIVGCSYVLQSKSFSDNEWTQENVDGTFKVFVDAGANGQFEEVEDLRYRIATNEQHTVDIRPYLINGRNQVRIQVIADNEEQTSGTLTYTVYMSEMYIDALNLDWCSPFIEGDTSYTLGGFKIVGSLSKTLWVKISDKNGVQQFIGSKDIGTSSFTSSPAFFRQSDISDGSSMFPALGTGVYKVDVWLEAGSVKSNVLTYSIMCISASEKDSAQLIVVNNVVSSAFNYDTNKLFEYAVYNKGYSTANAHIVLNGRNEGSTTVILYDETLTVSTGVVNDYTKNIEWNITGVSGSIALFFTATNGNIEMNSIALDNTGAYEAETNGLVFYMNAANRGNGQADRESIYNDAPLAESREIAATWKNMSWVDGIDGWTEDDKGRKCLRIPAGSRVSIPYSIFKGGDNTAFDITFKCVNVADYNENVITMALNPESEGFYGVRIKPTNITIHSNSDNSSNGDEIRGTNFADEETVNIFVSVARNYGGNKGANIVSGFINGVVGFHISYATGTVWANDVPIVIGSDTCDTFIYAIHAYSQAHDMAASEKNFVNSMENRQARMEMHRKMNLLLDGTHNIDYNKVKNNKLNFFEVEMLESGGATTIPSKKNGWAKKDTGRSNFTMHFGEHPEWDFTIFDVETAGQGTTSMDYWLWNLRWRIDKSNSDKKCNVAYYNPPTVDASGNRIFSMKPAGLSKTVKFDGDNHPALMRITAKINFASSMQSHKIGATRAFDVLHGGVYDGALLNEAQIAADEAGIPRPVVAVYQYPAYGFKKTLRPGTTDTYDYEFIGLFTIGPDKGDKPTFGYDKTKSSLISMEGTDHTPVMTTFHYPWNEEAGVAYDATKDTESLGVYKADKTFEKAWEVSNILGGSTDGDASVAEANMVILRREFKPAYEKAYKNNTMIFGISASDGYGSTPSDIVSAIENDNAFATKETYFGRYYSDCQFWIEGEYRVYFKNVVTGHYQADVNLLDQCGITEDSTVTLNGTDYIFSSLTKEQKNEYFRQQRRTFFALGNPNAGFDSNPCSAYWDVKDTLFHLCFLVIMGASDNFAKNTYPYKMKAIADGGRWKWRQDDLDSLLDIDNQGKQTKPYFIEYLDKVEGTSYFNGSNSYFWTLMYESFHDEMLSMGQEILNTMSALGSGTGSLNKMMNFFRKYFWNNAQEYFFKSSYNADATIKYIDAFISKGQDVDPLAQSLGDHYRAEFQWALRRSIYAMSLFRAGAFADRTDSSLGLMSFRASVGDMQMKPAIAMYPALHIGASGHKYSPDRVLEGESTVMNLVSASDTTVYIPATDWYVSLGDWKDFTILGTNDKALSVNGKRLQEFKIGDEDASLVSCNLQSIDFSNTPSLKKVDARNVSGLEGNVDLTGCPRLNEALFDGTKTTAILIPDGSKINILSLSDYTNSIIFKRLRNLTMDNLRLPATMNQVNRLQVEKCNHIEALDLLKKIVDEADSDAEGYRLYARLAWEGVKRFTDADSIAYSEMLNKIATNPDKYFGLTATGEPNDDVRPLIEGEILLDGSMYFDVIQNIINEGDSITKDETTGITTVVSSKFGTLTIGYYEDKMALRFADPVTQGICVANFDTNGDGALTLGEIAAVTSIPAGLFKAKGITSFDELQYFTSLTSIVSSTGKGQFADNPELVSVKLPKSLTTLSTEIFKNCTSLVSIGDASSITIIEAKAFNNCKALAIVIDLPNLKTLGQDAFCMHGSTTGCLVGIENLGKITTISDAYNSSYGCFRGQKSLTYAKLPNTLTRIGSFAFYGCSALASVDFPSSLTTIGSYAFANALDDVDCNFDNLTTLGDAAFYKSGLRSFSAPLLEELPGVYNNASAFSNCSKLKTINIPNVKSIPYKTFENCAIEGQLNLNVTNIGFAAFKGNKISSLVCSEGLETISGSGDYANGAFTDCALLTHVDFPSTVTSIGKHCFLRCKQLVTFICRNVTPPTLGPEVFTGTNTALSIYVPDSSVDTYRAASGWSTYASKIKPLSEYVE